MSISFFQFDPGYEIVNAVSKLRPENKNPEKDILNSAGRAALSGATLGGVIGGIRYSRARPGRNSLAATARTALGYAGTAAGVSIGAGLLEHRKALKEKYIKDKR